MMNTGNTPQRMELKPYSALPASSLAVGPEGPREVPRRIFPRGFLPSVKGFILQQRYSTSDKSSYLVAGFALLLQPQKCPAPHHSFPAEPTHPNPCQIPSPLYSCSFQQSSALRAPADFKAAH